MYLPSTIYGFELETGTWQTDSYRAFGVHGTSSPYANITLGKNGLPGLQLHGNLTLRPNQWYSYMIAVDVDGTFLALIWDRVDPNKSLTVKFKAGEKWKDRNWQYTTKVADSKMGLSIDNFAEISFDTVK
jgi:hypothetical protein